MSYNRHIRDHVKQIKSKLQSLIKGTSSKEDYLHKATSLALVPHGVGKLMEDDDFIICLLRGLGSEFDPIMAFYTNKTITSPHHTIGNSFHGHYHNNHQKYKTNRGGGMSHGCIISGRPQQHLSHGNSKPYTRHGCITCF